MKWTISVFIMVFWTTQAFGQVSEGKSGVQKFSISKNNTETKKSLEENRVVTDSKAPLITLQSPMIEEGSVWKSDSKTLIVKGKVQDEGGIFEVLVNGFEAKVAEGGVFQAEIPQAFGMNSVKIVAADVSLNRSELQFYTERSADQIPDLVSAEIKKSENRHSVDFISPASNASLANDKVYLQASIKSTEPIWKVTIHTNNSFVNGLLGNKLVANHEGAYMVDELLTLSLGINDIRIDVYTASDTISKQISVEYSLYAARNFALLIGNEEYDDPGISDLSEPVNDATEFYKTLTRLYTFEPENTILLKNPTKSEIIGTLHKLRSQVKEEDNLLIFYAGHGFWDEGMGTGYWLPRDAESDNPVDWIPNTDLTNYLGAIKTKHTLLIADACFSGGIFKTRAAFSENYAIEMLYQLNSRKAITSGTLTEVPDKSAFFQYFNKGLKDNTKDYFPAEELFSKMRVAVINNSENVPQFGTIQNVGDEGGDFIFVRRK